MNKKFWLWLAALVVILGILIGFGCLHSWWHSPGVHILGGKANIHLQQSAYIINEATGEVTGTTSVLILGQVTNGKGSEYGGKFEGYITIDGFEIPYAEAQSMDAMYGKIEKPYLDISYSGGRYYSQGGVPVLETSISYYIEIDTRRPEDVIIRVVDNTENVYYYVVHADSEEAAIQWFNEFKQARHGKDYPTLG